MGKTLQNSFFIILTFTSLNCFAGGESITKYRWRVPSLQAYAAMEVAIRRFPDETLEKKLAETQNNLVNAGCEILKNLTGYGHNGELGSVDWPDLAHYALAIKWITPEKALESAKRKNLTNTAQEIRDQAFLPV